MPLVLGLAALIAVLAFLDWRDRRRVRRWIKRDFVSYIKRQYGDEEREIWR